MIKKIIISFLVLTTAVFAQPEFSNYNSMAGSFSRMGFGARGMGMGNSIGAVTEGNIVSYYNPALSNFQNDNSFQTSYSILSLDRSLNFLSFTKKFKFGKSKIDSTKRFSEKLALGIGLKFYYYKLYEEITSTAFGFDIGALYIFNDNLTFGATITDINTKYKWDTSKIYGTSGNSTINKFPLLMKIAAAYKFDTIDLLTSIELEHSNADTDFLRLGIEHLVFEQLFLRAGIDRISISNFDIPMRPSFGFSYSRLFSGVKIGVDYAFVLEPYSSHDQHIIGVNVVF